MKSELKKAEIPCRLSRDLKKDGIGTDVYPVSFFDWRIMEKLKLYRVKNRYINYLSSQDDKVQHNKNAKRPYVGIVLRVDNYQYFVPLESPKPNHVNVKSGKHLLKIDGGNLGIMGFNNMIPVHNSALISFDINSEEDEAYIELLKRQVRWINKNKEKVLGHAQKTYNEVVVKNNSFMKGICCDFKKLERACNRYNPNFKRKNNRNQ